MQRGNMSQMDGIGHIRQGAVSLGVWVSYGERYGHKAAVSVLMVRGVMT